MDYLLLVHTSYFRFSLNLNDRKFWCLFWTLLIDLKLRPLIYMLRIFLRTDSEFRSTAISLSLLAYPTYLRTFTSIEVLHYWQLTQNSVLWDFCDFSLDTSLSETCKWSKLTTVFFPTCTKISLKTRNILYLSNTWEKLDK